MTAGLVRTNRTERPLAGEHEATGSCHARGVWDLFLAFAVPTTATEHVEKIQGLLTSPPLTLLFWFIVQYPSQNCKG